MNSNFWIVFAVLNGGFAVIRLFVSLGYLLLSLIFGRLSNLMRGSVENFAGFAIHILALISISGYLSCEFVLPWAVAFFLIALGIWMERHERLASTTRAGWVLLFAGAGVSTIPLGVLLILDIQGVF